MKKELDWRIFAKRLTDLSKAEGQSHFLNQAFIFLNEFVVVDSCAVFKVAADKTSGAEHLCTFGSLNPQTADLLAEDYVANGFKNDPMVQTALLTPKVRVRQLPLSDYSQAYRSQYFKSAKLIDKVTSIHSSRNVLFLVSFYRIENNGPFTQDNFRDLERVAPIIGRFVLRHERLNRNKQNMDDTYSKIVTSLVEDNTQIFSRLSKRERVICKNLLLGKAEREIADILSITINTVVTHRRRFYAKLNIGSKSDLFRLALITQTLSR